MMSIVFY